MVTRPDSPLPNLLAPLRAAVPAPFSSDDGLWNEAGTRNVAAVAEIYRRHGAVSYAVALTITQDGERAEHAVIAAFVRLCDHAAVRRRPRSVRIEVLDATRQSAGSLAPGRMPKRWVRRRRPGDAYRSLSPDVRDVVALAVAGRCRCIEIASIMRTDHSTVRRDLSSGLRDAASFLGTTRQVLHRAAGVPLVSSRDAG